MNNSLNKRRFLLTIIVGLLLFGIGAPAKADGLLLISGVYRQPAKSHISVTIKGKIATTVLEQTFRNELDQDIEATYIAPVPPDATVTNFAMLFGSEWVEATIKASEQAKKEFDSAVKNQQDAALASQTTAVPQNPSAAPPPAAFLTKVSLAAKAERSVRLTYTQVLNGEVGLTRYIYPLSSSNLTDEKVGDLLVSVKIIENDEIRAVYSPTHGEGVEVSRPDKNTAEVVYRAQNLSAKQNFELIYTQSSDRFGLNLASYRERDDEDGFFVLVGAPQLEVKTDDVIQKDFVFVLDVSGSMQGEKATQAKKALNGILSALNTGDRFIVVTFSSGVTPFADILQPLDRRADAQQWVTNFPVAGGTNINDAVISALNTTDQSKGAKARPHIVVFLTDGLATNGVIDTRAILENVRATIKPQTRIYTIGVGDVNKDLLASLAEENRGTGLFVTATEPLEKPLASFYAAIDNPVLVDLALNYGDVEVYDVYPNPIPDMFLGGQVVVTGRYKKGGATTVTLNGNINGEKHTSTYKDIKFVEKAADSASTSYVSRLWAQRKVDAMLRQINTNGPDEQIVAQIRDLGMRYNIITPYTSFVVTNPKDLPKAGLPFLYVDQYRTANTSLMIVGACLALVGLAGFALSKARKQG
jgi:Ca-activated chloride channel homolog